MRLPVPGPRDVLSALERGGDQVEALMGAVPRMLALLAQAEVLVARADGVIDRVEAVAEAAAAEVVRVGTVVDDAKVQIDRVGTVVDDAKVQIDRVGAVVDGAQERIDSVGTVVDGAAVQVGRAASLMDVLEPPLTTLQPTLQTLADTTHPDEVAALVQLIDHLPQLTEQVERDVLPVLATLGSVAPDVHELLNVSRELNEILGKIPGIGRLKRRVEEEDEDPDR
jgi:ABC-type transporter Mla subunit MlaD